MKKELNDIIEGSPNKAILLELKNHDEHQVIDLILEKLAQKNKKPFFSFFGKKKHINEGYLAMKILLALMMDNYDDHKLYQLNFEENYGTEIAELGRILLILNKNQDSEREDKLAFKLKKLINKAAVYIQKNYNNYPKNLIKSKVWKAGAEIRKWAAIMALYFEEKNNINGKLEMLYARGRVTNSILNHYFYLVAPDMNAIALCFEKIGYTDSAKKFYKPLLKDFEWVLEDIISLIDEQKTPSPEDIISLKALKNAYEGAHRTDPELEENKFQNKIEQIEHILKKYDH